MGNTIKKITYGVVAMALVFLMSSCREYRENRIYHIKELDMFVTIECLRIHEDGKVDFRINLSKSENFNNEDFIDITVPVYECNDMLLVFPTKEDKKVYVMYANYNVDRIQCEEYDIKHITQEGLYDGKTKTLRKWKQTEIYLQEYSETQDSITDIVPSVMIRLNAYMKGWSKFIDGKYVGDIPVYDTWEKTSGR